MNETHIIQLLEQIRDLITEIATERAEDNLRHNSLAINGTERMLLEYYAFKHNYPDVKLPQELEDCIEDSKNLWIDFKFKKNSDGITQETIVKKGALSNAGR